MRIIRKNIHEDDSTSETSNRWRIIYDFWVLNLLFIVEIFFWDNPKSYFLYCFNKKPLTRKLENLPRCKGTPERTTCGRKPTRRKGCYHDHRNPLLRWIICIYNNNNNDNNETVMTMIMTIMMKKKMNSSTDHCESDSIFNRNELVVFAAYLLIQIYQVDWGMFSWK